MITSIVVTGEHNIKMNSSKKIKINDNILSVEKDIPFIRYRFDSYNESSINYIENMMKQFCMSTHLVEIKLDSNIVNYLQLLSDKSNSLAEYVYIELTEDEVQAKCISESKMELIGQAVQFNIDRYMLKDKSTSLDTVTAKTIIKAISKRFNIPEDKIGVCSSPLSFGELACLTAVKARELMSIYSTIADVALPSANHQCMNCCGCIRYMVVDGDTEAPADAKLPGASKKEKKDSGSDSANTEKAEKTVTKVKPKNVIIPGMYNL